MLTSHFDYHLPNDRIAQEPVRPRDHSRLLVLDRTAGTWTHHRFYDIGTFLRPNDLLVVNESKVFKARLRGRFRRDDPVVASTRRRPDQDVEIFLLRPEGSRWLALAKPGRIISVGSIIAFADGISCNVIAKLDDGTIAIDFHASANDIFAWTDKAGEIPTPPYVERAKPSADDYQTVYARTTGSVAAPTAGFHFTPELIQSLKDAGIRFATVTLHVGLGTFRPIKTETLEEHVMHEEWIDMPKETRNAIVATKQSGGRVIAVGTTTVRALESDVEHGLTDIFITPGYRFKAVDGLITNFHLPKSSLLVLVSSFVGASRPDSDEGRRIALRAYEDAIREGYRFYSFGDAMLIV
ncbi:MAG TPA: tRNA preQ1(34) S-adenosylmethionine ribosyltransferase-isomerase QueA [Candidatus Methylomirabilis sp.]|nr:tRNA preQ1(34) S-adenosylmethionine ribosyltransferase-isomerase QueA [Candidatus Methylomirabilis sp.]